jgi:hypothetical protein
LQTKNTIEENIKETTGSPQAQIKHAVPIRDFEKVTWTRKIIDDDSRLPSTYHILFAVLDQPDESVFQAAVKKFGQRFKIINGLGGFAICDSEAKAESIFHELASKVLVYPLKDVPRPIRNDQLRSEICFMEGMRPQKNTSVANRLIYKHLGFK